MSTKSTIAHDREWHLYTDVLDDAEKAGQLYFDIAMSTSLEERDPHLQVARAEAAITIALPNKLVDAIVKYRLAQDQTKQKKADMD